MNEPGQFSRKVEVRTTRDVMFIPEGHTTHRQEYVDALRAYNAEGGPTLID